MVTLNKIYTRTGDDGSTGLGSGERRSKFDLRVSAYGTVDETNAVIGCARAACTDRLLGDMLMRVQNDLFDLGADLATPSGTDLPYDPLRIDASQVTRLEREIDLLNARLDPLKSFVLPGGTMLSAQLHLARTVCRRAERLIVELAQTETVGEPALRYINRLSDLLFVAARVANEDGKADVLWVPGQSRSG
ncbi:cob(I)yrinic acid a,c-diamide adenosyltransferase [Acuticoccus sp. I52.16.1]|uniref:cob(I)yrinic acid a,c-diamide adenosyltransferase n=1 Tax=Acuticoccus sp. I52.16.1 TaxID=2928472 RepID=UPI001FD520D8|nr:cob(I)yrinic acid a,c-diamide adenosyltransferase [Acuticoccus sp. I52.16.1]UOM32799.1 cob(I)yrinic acid a,c-diamide adenosyltransferase [Acuticoccus sp. I52.16.1]